MEEEENEVFGRAKKSFPTARSRDADGALRSANRKSAGLVDEKREDSLED